MNVFLTIEQQKDDKYESLHIVANHCMDLSEKLNALGIPTQLKITNLPRRKGWIKASELDNIESQ